MDALTAAFASHPRNFDRFRWVYPVLSRRSGGLSIGVNINPDRLCNFDCSYCQVDRRGESPSAEVDPAGVESEVRALLGRVVSTGLSEAFPGVDAGRRKLSDVALSGDGEPTLRPEFGEVCRRLAQVRGEWTGAGGVPYRQVVITNATLLDRAPVRLGLDHLERGGGLEIWGKLDAGTQDFYQRVNVSRVSLPRVVENLSATAARYPLRVQTLFFERDGVDPSEPEVQAWIANLEKILERGPLLGVQLHTIARATATPGCHPLAVEWLEAVAAKVQERTGLSVDVHAGLESGSFSES